MSNSPRLSALQSLRIKAGILREELSAANCTLYVVDPVWPSQYRLLAMPGVGYPEAMHGFTIRAARATIGEGDPTLVVTAGDSPFRNPLLPGQNGNAHHILFGDFAHREGIESSVRARGHIGTKYESTLFVNFGQADRATWDVAERAHAFLREIEPTLHDVLDELTILDATQCFPKMIRLADPANSPLAHDLSTPDQQRAFFDKIASIALETLEVNQAEGVATIQILNRQRQCLEVVGRAGCLKDGAGEPVSVLGHRGVACWVAQMGSRSALISDLSRSGFGNIHIPIMDGAQSEVAVPILAGGDFVGVLNVESIHPDKFSDSALRALWYGAAKVALAFKLKEFTRANAALLEVCQRATSEPGHLSMALDSLAEIAADRMSASQCEVWLWDEQDECFVPCGSTAKLIDEPRHRGWTQLIQKRLTVPVWIDSGSHEIRSSYWSDGMWWPLPGESGLEAEDLPPDLHPVVIRQGIVGHLGVPVRVRHETHGVAWFRYAAQRTPPDSSDMRTLGSFIEQLGLAADCAYAQRLSVQKRRARSVAARVSEHLLTPTLVSVQLEAMPRPFLRGGLATKALDPGFGGDFFSLVPLDGDAVGLLIGDGQEHGVSGVMNMLPLLATFNMVCRDSVAAVHVLHKMGQTADAFGARATALYALFRRDSWRRGNEPKGEPPLEIVLTAASKGHPGLMVVDDEGVRYSFPTMQKTGVMLGMELPGPHPIEELCRLRSGALVIGFTDGVSDSINPGQMFKTVSSRTGEHPQVIADAILSEAIRAQRDNDLRDDATVVVIEII